MVRGLAGKDLNLVKEDLDRAIALYPQEWAFHALRALIDFKQAAYARALGDACLSYLYLHRTEFDPAWCFEYVNDDNERRVTWYAGITWHPAGERRDERKAARPPDLTHNFAATGLKALWALACR